jgi:hypothetical protein
MLGMLTSQFTFPSIPGQPHGNLQNYKIFCTYYRVCPFLFVLPPFYVSFHPFVYAMPALFPFFFREDLSEKIPGLTVGYLAKKIIFRIH